MGKRRIPPVNINGPIPINLVATVFEINNTATNIDETILKYFMLLSDFCSSFFVELTIQKWK
jgi:hypothetical protein